MTALAARARGLLTTVLTADSLAELDRAPDAASLARLGFSADTLDRLARDRCARDLALLARRSDELDAFVLDEDRRSVRAVVRGFVAGTPASRRLAAAVPTPRLSARVLAQLAAAATLRELARLLGSHPYASVIASATLPVDLFAIELALARRFAEVARARDPALRVYLAQLIDAENAGAAIALAARGRGLAADDELLPGGKRLDRATFAAAAAGNPEVVLARVFAGTPLSRALFAPAPAALEDATLAWQLATQARLRLTDPLSLAPALYTLLRRRDEARHLRRAAWRIALGGAA